MNKNIESVYIRSLCNVLIFLEEVDTDVLDDDNVVELMESISSEFQELSIEDREYVKLKFLEVSESYCGKNSKFIKDIPETLGISF